MLTSIAYSLRQRVEWNDVITTSLHGQCGVCYQSMPIQNETPISMTSVTVRSCNNHAPVPFEHVGLVVLIASQSLIWAWRLKYRRVSLQPIGPLQQSWHRWSTHTDRSNHHTRQVWYMYICNAASTTEFCRFLKTLKAENVPLSQPWFFHNMFPWLLATQSAIFNINPKLAYSDNFGMDKHFGLPQDWVLFSNENWTERKTQTTADGPRSVVTYAGSKAHYI